MKTGMKGKSGSVSAAAKEEEQKLQVAIPRMQIGMIKLKLRGLSPLLVHRFSEKAKEQMTDKDEQKAKHKRPPRDPQAEFEAAQYKIDGNGSTGFPASGFKKAAVSATRYAEGISQIYAKGSFHVLGDLIRIEGDPPRLHESPVRIGRMGAKTAQMRYRACYEKWEVELPIRYNLSAITPEQISHLFSIAGFSIGVGDWRPEHDGSFGMFEVV